MPLAPLELCKATNKQVVTKSPPSWTSSLQNGMRDKYCTPINLVAQNKESCFPLHDETQGQIEWMIDSGASNHFTFDKNDFIEYETITKPIQVQAATATTKVTGKGTIILITNGSAYRIGPVYHVPELNCRLLSLGQFHRSRLYSRGSARKIKLYNEYSGLEFLLFYPRHDKGTTYIIKTLLGNFEEQKTIHTVNFEIMHRRLAHPSKEVQRKAEKNVKDYPKGVLIPEEPHVCPGCAQGKMTDKSFPPSETRASEPFELVHSDLKSFPIESYQKYKYFIVFFDDYTSHAWTINIQSKDAALQATRQFLAIVETKYKTKVQRWKLDAGGEYTSKAFYQMLKDKGIEILQSVPHVHQQNGRAERIVCTLMEKAKSIRLQACLPQSWWEFALDHVTHIYNQTPIHRLSWLTPYTMLMGDKPSIEHLRVFGSGAYVFIPAEVWANKLSPKSELMVYLGTAPGGKGWIFMRGPNNVIFTTANATFDESLFPRCPKQAGVHKNTKLQTTAPKPKQCSGSDCHCPLPSEDYEEEQPVPLPNVKGKAKETRQQAREREIEAQIRCIPLPTPSEAPPVTMPPRREVPPAQQRQVIPQ